VNLYFFDLDKTLYAYDFRRRLPALARMTGASQYQLASRWWAGGYERRAEAGEWPTPDAYLDHFAEVTGTRRLSLDEWADARRGAMTPMPESIAALRHAATLGTVSLLSNNPAATGSALPLIAPDVAEILGPNALFSYMLGARKPGVEVYQRALAHFGAETAYLLDDTLPNVIGARDAGLTAVHLAWVGGVPQTDGLIESIDSFARRNR
jgi:putative hydrolase of the HAD superfamily